jgi:hypothetical protein
MIIVDNLFCCLPQEKQDKIKTDIDCGVYSSIYLNQKNLIEEKNGYRCSKCGKFFPFLSISYQCEVKLPEAISKLKGKLIRYKKSADIFCGDYYYAKSKKFLHKYELCNDGNVQLTDEIPIIGDMCYVSISPEERFIAAESFNGTIEIVDTVAKIAVAKKKKCRSNGKFIFGKENELLYFDSRSIVSWEFLNGAERSVWQIPKEWETPEGQSVTCNNIIHNRVKGSFLFQLSAQNISYAVIIKDGQHRKTVPLPQLPTLCKITFAEEMNQYTFVCGGRIHVCDENFNTIEEIQYPHLTHISDGGGAFPITRLSIDSPDRAILSPDGGWILLDYFNYIILMDHRDYTIKHCVYSYTGKVASHMGFLDSNRFWYTWGNSTCVQDIDG